MSRRASEATGFFKGKAKKGPFKLEEFQDKYRYQLQDEQQALDQAQDAARASNWKRRSRLIPRTCKRSRSIMEQDSIDAEPASSR